MAKLLTALALARCALAAPCAQSCPVVFDGRVPSTATLSDFDTRNGGGWNPFNPSYVKGNDLSWSEIIQLPDVEPSLFDQANATIPLEVTLSDASIFQQQKGFRRAGLQFSADTNNGSPGAEGVKTLHWSLRVDEQRGLNYSHEYLLVWHERGDYNGNQFNFETGALIGREGQAGGEKTWKLLGRKENVLWNEEIEEGVWSNFAVTLDFEEKMDTDSGSTIAAYYSTGNDPLEQVLEPTANDNSGEGQYQIGMLKKPTGTDDVVNSGYQESDLDEGLIYGGLFLEDGEGGCFAAKGGKKRRV